MKNVRTFLFVVWVIFIILNGSANAYFQVIDLGTLGGNPSWANSINDNGQIVGDVYDSSGYIRYSRACLFDPTGGGANVDLGSLGSPQSSARSINNNGQIVGDADDSSGYQRACLFDPTGGGANIDLGTLGGDGSSARCINDNGQIVGFAEEGFIHACLFDPTGGGANIDLGTLGGPKSRAYSINNNGQIVGRAAGPWDMEPVNACLFDPTGGGANTLLFNFSRAYSINDNGQIIGWREDEKACIFNPPMGITLLGALGGGRSYAVSNNNSGQIVGRAEISTGEYHACLFDPTGEGNNIDLNNLIDPSSGWTLVSARDINNKGWIVGSGINPDGYERAFLLIPEPASALMLGFSGIFLALRRHRR